MSDTRPRLVALPQKPDQSPEDSPAGSPGAETRTAPERIGRNPLLWILAAAFVLCALGWLSQAREARELAASLQATEIALGRAQNELRAYDQHLSRVGTQVGVVREQLDSLQLLVEEGPGDAPEP
jgi:hypothetical protein